MKYGCCLALLLSFFSACGPADTASSATDATPSAVLDTTARMAAIRAEYARIEALRGTNRVRVDSLGYECEELVGFFRFYYRDDTLLLAEREYVAGDHFGGVERYYFQHNTPLFAFQQESTWQFTGAERTGPDGEMIPNTRDDFHEVRTYYTAAGQPFYYLYKDYSHYSDRDNPAPETLPNQSEGKGVQASLGPYALRLVAERDSVDCAVVR